MAEIMNIDISPEGEVTIEVNGVKGKACASFSEPVERALGVTVEDTKTREWHERATTESTRVRQ